AREGDRPETHGYEDGEDEAGAADGIGGGHCEAEGPSLGSVRPTSVPAAASRLKSGASGLRQDKSCGRGSKCAEEEDANDDGPERHRSQQACQRAPALRKK